MLIHLAQLFEDGPGGQIDARLSGSEETEIYLSARQREAARGDLIGLVSIAMYGYDHYALAIKGEIHRSPVFARRHAQQLPSNVVQLHWR